MKRSAKQFAALYQLAGDLLIGSNVVPCDSPLANTVGQNERMLVLLLDALSEPDNWGAKTIRDAHRRMKVP